MTRTFQQALRPALALLWLAIFVGGSALAQTPGDEAISTELGAPTEAAPADAGTVEAAPVEAAPADPTIAPAPRMLPTQSEDPYNIKLRELEEQVVGLKEKIFRSKTRLLLLKERILNDVIAEAKSVIVHINDMGGSFEAVQVLYHLDGEKIYFQDNASGAIDSSQPIEIFSGNVMPGNHVLSVEMVYRGTSGVFVYLDDYVFRLRANYTFYATKGKVTQVSSIGYQKGDITYDLTERPSIKFGVTQVSYIKENTVGGAGDPDLDGEPAVGDE